MVTDGVPYACTANAVPDNSITIFNNLCNHSNDLRILFTNVDDSKGSISHRSHIFIDNYYLPLFNDICLDGRRSLAVDNAGGRSAVSEMFSIDYFSYKYKATDILLEMEVGYWIDYKMVDFICTIDHNRIGVSVARAMGFPTALDFTKEKAENLIKKKLFGLIVARNSVIKKQSFLRSVLHIWCQSEHIAQLLYDAYQALDENDYGLDIKGIVILQLTVCDDVQLYQNFII